MSRITFPLVITPKGYTAYWECGGATDKETGHSIIICDWNGNKLPPIFITKTGKRACDNHALFVIKPGYHIIFTDYTKGEYGITVLRVVKTHPKGVVTLKQKNLYSNGKWNKEPRAALYKAINAGRQKAVCVDCRNPHYYRKMEESKKAKDKPITKCSQM